MLSDNEVRFFNTFGYLILKNGLTTDEVARLQDEYEARVEETARVVPLSDDESRDISGLVPSTPFATELFEDDRLAGVGEQLFGEVICANAIIHRYVSDSVWHYDAGGYDAYGLKVAIYLDPVRADSGALRVIPGSHLRPYHDDVTAVDPIGSRFSRAAATPDEHRAALDGIDRVPSVVCDSDEGDLLFFDLRTFHASKGGRIGRRMCSFTYYNYPHQPGEIELTILNAQGAVRRRDNTDDPWNPPGIPAEWEANADRYPRRKFWLDSLRTFARMEPGQRGVQAVVENGKWKIEKVA